MKKLIISFLIFGIFTSTFASSNSLSIPMSIFGDIISQQNMSGATLNIYNTDKFLLNSLKLSGNNYGTNDAFEIEKKVNLNQFDNSLLFEIISGNSKFSNIPSTSTGNYNCDENPVFQTNKLCKYDLNLTNINPTNIINLGSISNLQVSNLKDTALTISWDTISNIDGFVIISENNNAQIKQTGNIYDFNNLLPNTDYKIKIYAYKGDIIGEIKELNIKTPISPKQVSAGTIEVDVGTSNDLKTNEEVKIIKSTKQDSINNFSQINALETTNDTNIIISKAPVSLDNTTALTERIVFLGENTEEKIVFSIPAGVKANNNAIIYPPVIIDRKEDLKTKIQNSNLNVNIASAMQVPTSQSTTFNGDIELCMPANGRSNIGNLVIYYSTDGNTWQKDTNAKGLKIANEKICFKTNHLTSFASLEETIISSGNTGNSSGGGGGEGISSTPTCTDVMLQCSLNISGNYVWKIKTSCTGGNLGKSCIPTTQTGTIATQINPAGSVVTTKNITLNKAEINNIIKEVKKSVIDINGKKTTILIPNFPERISIKIDKVTTAIIKIVDKKKLSKNNKKKFYNYYSLFLIGLKFDTLGDIRGKKIMKASIKKMIELTK